MTKWMRIVVRMLRSACRSHSALVLENLALRLQPTTFKQREPRPRLRVHGELFFMRTSVFRIGRDNAIATDSSEYQ